MANLRRTRKKVHGIPRAPDGSAFQKCNTCGASVPIVLAGMHECDLNPKVKRFKGVCLDVQKQSFYDQLIVMSPFHFFMKEFTKTSEAGNWVAINREGFEAWKNMSEKERQPYVAEAEKVDKAYKKALLEEADDKQKVDDEADSATMGRLVRYVCFKAQNTLWFNVLWRQNSDGNDELWDNDGRAGSWQTYARPIGYEFPSGKWSMIFEDSEV